ncbi:MAG: S8 family serine peptidase [Clostridia bacterium]|nr:S8 family serine peptidase [Clostridia bacterium]
MKKYIKRISLILTLIFAMSSASAFAEAPGYIFKLKPDTAATYSDAEGIESISSDGQLYSAKTLDDIYSFVGEENIDFITEDCLFYLFGFPDDAPNDPYYESSQWNLPLINMPAVWKKGYRGENATVCVIDSGLWIDHPDIIKDNIIDSYDVFTKTSDVSDIVGHGTFVTGTIAAAINNNTGISGIADETNIIPLKIFNQKTTNLSYILEALDKIDKEYDIDVLNMSLGTSENEISDSAKYLLKDAVDKLVDKNIIVVAAVGNTGHLDNAVNYPAGFENVIGVGGVASNKNLCYFSQHNDSVFLVAPGGIEKQGASAGYLCGLGITEGASSYVYGGGTSYSTPQVSAVAAIAKSIYPDLTPKQFQDILAQTSEDLGDKGYDTSYGYGLLNAGEVVKAVEDIKNATPTPTYSPAPTPIETPAASPSAQPQETEIPVASPSAQPQETEAPAASPSAQPQETETPVASPTIEPTLTPTEAPTPTPFVFDPDNYDLSFENNEVVITTTDSEAIVYMADYDGRTLVGLKQVKLSEHPDYKENTNTYKIPADSQPSKIFLWHGMQCCIEALVSPDYVEPTPEPTIEPTIEPTVEPTTEPTSEPTYADELEQTLFELINKKRADEGIAEFETTDKISSVARKYSTSKSEGVESPNINDFIKQEGLLLKTGTAKSTKFPERPSETIFNTLIANDTLSPLLMSEEYTHIGIGAVSYLNGEDDYCYLTLLFCTPR